MRCHICNSVLSPPEINQNSDHQDWEPCGTCLDIINDIFNTEKTEDEIDRELEHEDIDIYDEEELYNDT